ncbi:hypothetical protein MUNTM_08910 [Mycobacterium sp. MUNTM1]
MGVIDTNSHTVTTTINVGNRLWGIAVDPATHAAYVTDSNDTVSVIAPTR